jgi:hypothetical protein
MEQPAFGAFQFGSAISAARPLSSDPADSADSEADYCLARAEAESRCAADATHPAARFAHLQMAGLYRQRALAARAEAGAIVDWLGEVVDISRDDGR